MSRADPASHYSPAPNILERRASAFVRRYNRSEETTLRARRPQELAVLRRIERWAVFWAFLAGAISGGLLGAAEVLGQEWYGLEGMRWQAQLPFWAGFLVVAGVVSGIEILFLYWNALKASARIGEYTGLALTEGGHQELITRGLGRAALEFPNPHDPLYGIDPYARTPRWKLRIWALMYRLKVGVSSFVLRILLRRILGRAALRSLVPLVTGPLYAIWNAIITWRIVREARIRTLGPFAVEELVEYLRQVREELSEQERVLIVAATGEMLIRSQDAHPNFVYLLSRLIEVLEVPQDRVEVDWEGQRERLRDMEECPQSVLLRVLVVASLLDGRITTAKTDLLVDAHRMCGRAFEGKVLGILHEKLLQGQPMTRQDFARLWSARD